MANMAKKKKPTMSKAGAAIAALKFYGQEPSFEEGHLIEGTQLARTYAWYNYNSSYPEGKKYLIAYLKEQKADKELIKCVRGTHERKMTPTVYWISRILSNGYNLPQSTIQYLQTRLSNIQENYVHDHDESSEENSVVDNKPSIQDRMREVLWDIIGDIEEKIDEMDFKFSLYDHMKMNGIKPAYGPKISDHYKRLEAELAEAITGKSKDLKEAYGYLSKPNLKKFHKMIIGIIEDGYKFADAQKKLKKTSVRIKKPIPIDKKVKGVKYLKEYDPLKIASIAPKEIIGAQSLWLYDTKSKRVINLIADSDRGLDVKGTTVISFSEELSKCKRARKPHEVVDEILKGGKIKLKKVFDNMTTKEMDVKGRINANMIILKVLKQ